MKYNLIKGLKILRKIYLRKRNYTQKHIESLSSGYPKNNNVKEFGVYSDYLKKAFKDPSIRNIAITGNYGIGKSSFLNKWSRKKKYLFISLCSFSNRDSDSLECDLLQQLFLGCGYSAKDKQFVQDKWPLYKKVIFFVFGLIIGLTIYFFVFSNIFEPTLGVWNIKIPTEIIAKIKSIVYGLFAILLVFGIATFIEKFVEHFRLSKIALKFKNTEIEAESKNDIPTSYIDRHRLDLVYALRQAAKKIDYTIIFEDMDRLKMSDCRLIFTELRELNRLVNSGFLGKKAKKTMRFIYVIHDAVFSDDNLNVISFDELLHLKFFDYIMPIIPSLVGESSSNYVAKCFEKVEIYDYQFINEISRYLVDYRLIKNITNEYVVAKDIFLSKNNDKLDSKDKLQLMALIIYKNLMPCDYKKIRDGQSVVFNGRSSQEITVTNETVQCLIDNEWLSYGCFKFIGYDCNETRKYIEMFWKQSKEDNIKDNNIKCKMLREDFDLCCIILTQKHNSDICINSVCYTILEMILKSKETIYFSLILSKYVEFDTPLCEQYDENHEKALKEYIYECSRKDESIDNFLTVMDYLNKTNLNNYDWFFQNNSVSSDELLDDFRWKIICSLNDSLLNSFIQNSKSLLISWLNTISETKGIPKDWRNLCRKNTANIMGVIEFNEQVRNYFESIS